MVSVIIPVFQISGYIERCILSLMAQSYTGIECIIVDDATQDDSILKCERLIRDYDGQISFQIIKHEINRGLSAARNTGMNAATGEYIYFLDGDDEITPDCIEKLTTLAKRYPEAEIIQGNSKMIPYDARKKTYVDNRIPDILTTNRDIAYYFHKYWIPTNAWNKLVKRSFLTKFGLYFKEGLLYEDRLWMFFVMKHLSKICLCKDVSYYYYMREGSIVNGADSIAVGNSFVVIYDEIFNNLTVGREKDELDCYVEGFCNYYLKYKSVVPNFYRLYHSYVEKTTEYGCRLSRIKLMVAKMMGNVPFGIKILQFIKDIKTYIKLWA